MKDKKNENQKIYFRIPYGKMMVVLMKSIYSYIERVIKRRTKNLGVALRYIG